jgi:hypothetical protein
MDNLWSHLPNAAHIDRVITSLKSHPDIWNAAYDEACDAAFDVSRVAASAAAHGAVSSARGAVWDAARAAVWDAARGAAWGAILALIAYDDAVKYLNMTSDQLKMWAILSEGPAVLLLPAVIAYEKISELDTA